MGYRQSMVVLGGWYLYQCDDAVFSEPRLCQVKRIRGLTVRVYWTDVDMFGYAGVEYLTPVPEGLNNLLLSSKPQGE